jgi:hypothetical protein
MQIHPRFQELAGESDHHVVVINDKRKPNELEHNQLID